MSFSTEKDGTRVPTLSPGGLVAAVAPPLRGRNAAWVGWDGTDSGDTSSLTVDDIALFPVSMEKELVERHYEGFSNGTLWPLFHDVGVDAEFHDSWWEAYQKVNSLYAKQAAEIVDEGGIVWVHDYQMMLVPRILRDLRPDVTIGYFHHIPFCDLEKLRTLPHYQDLVEGLSGADISGFQRNRDRDLFRTAQLDIVDSAAVARAETYPISLDFDAVSLAAGSTEVIHRAVELREEWGNPTTVFLGVDRIDYTKGIPERLEAYEALLRAGELDVDDTVMVQAGSPSREGVPTYQDLRARIDEIVSRINRDFPTASGRPAVVFTAQNLKREEMLAFFVSADVMIVSSLRDGMNLVAKEYVACKNDEAGVLILSPHTGAADSMVEAIIADPTEPAELQSAFLQANTMGVEEQRTRMIALRGEVHQHDVAWWSEAILSDLASVSAKP